MIQSRAPWPGPPEEPLRVTTIVCAPPQAGEVLLRVCKWRLSHRLLHPLRPGPEGLFPAVLGHEGGAVVEAPGRRGDPPWPVGDHVIRSITRRNAGNARSACREKPISARRFVGTQGPGPDARWHQPLSPRTASPSITNMGPSTFSDTPWCGDPPWPRSGKRATAGEGVPAGRGVGPPAMPRVLNTAKGKRRHGGRVSVSAGTAMARDHRVG